MALKQFLQNLFERVGLVETPLPPPQAADVALVEPQNLRPILLRLAAWGVNRVCLVAGESPDADDLVQGLRQAAELGIAAGVRGRASDLTVGKLLSQLATAGARDVEIPVLSAVAEVHDALAGAGDCRSALKALGELASLNLPPAAQLVLTPSTWKTIQRTLNMLDDCRLREVRVWAVVCRDDEPASWALSAGQLSEAAVWIEAHAPRDMKIAWYPPLRFDPARTLAQQVRRGPRAAIDSVRIEADGGVLAPVGAAIAGGDVSQNDWKLIARSDVFRDWKRRRAVAVRCEPCPGLAACASGCLRDEGNWSRG